MSTESSSGLSEPTNDGGKDLSNKWALSLQWETKDSSDTVGNEAGYTELKHGTSKCKENKKNGEGKPTIRPMLGMSIFLDSL